MPSKTSGPMDDVDVDLLSKVGYAVKLHTRLGQHYHWE